MAFKINKMHTQKLLYGMKQSPRAWFDKFTRAVRKCGYAQRQSDHTLFIKQSPEGKKSILFSMLMTLY